MSNAQERSAGRAVADPIVDVRNVSVHFEMDRGTSRVVNDISVSLERNEILGVVGESGSGKSMFASALLDAVIEPGITEGDITYRRSVDDDDPIDVLDLSLTDLKRFRWEEVSMVFQGAMNSFNPVRKIRTHFTETLIAHDYNVSDGLDTAREILSDLYLSPDRVLDSYPHELSGGMRQRVLIALSLVLDPSVLVMDEPTAALDLLMQRSIISLIEDLQEKYDLTILFITHDLPLIAGLADRLAVMYAFEIVEIGPAEEILRNAAHPYTRSLLKSTPNLTTPLSEMRPIEGTSPDPVNIPDGCSYHPRCPLADERCRVEDPFDYQIDGDHVARCHHWEEAETAVPLFEETTNSDEVRYGGDQSSDPVVSLDGVSVDFASDDGGVLGFLSEPETVTAVDDVSLDIYENDVLVLVGESGCGKTTLGRAAVGVQEPTDGTVEFRGQDVWRAKRRLGEIDIPFSDIRRGLQIIHQDPGSSLNSNRRVKAILAGPLKRWHKNLDANDRMDLLLNMIEHVGMTPAEDYVERYPHQLSGGEQQRVALLRSILVNPDVILADEPVSALDVSLRIEIMDLMLDLQEMFDTSYLFVSHDLANARYISGKTGGRIAVMYLGKIVETGTVDEIIDDPRHPYTKALRWATPELDPDSEAAPEAPMRTIDVPDPSDPPRGCRYHTRCANVIPPEGYDFEQEEWNAVMDLRVAIERNGFDLQTLNEIIATDGEEITEKNEVEARVRDHFHIPSQLSDPRADRTLSTALAHIADDDVQAALALFEAEFPTICQTEIPPALEVAESERTHSVACFLEQDGEQSSRD